MGIAREFIDHWGYSRGFVLGERLPNTQLFDIDTLQFVYIADMIDYGIEVSSGKLVNMLDNATFDAEGNIYLSSVNQSRFTGRIVPLNCIRSVKSEILKIIGSTQSTTPAEPEVLPGPPIIPLDEVMNTVNKLTGKPRQVFNLLKICGPSDPEYSRVQGIIAKAKLIRLEGYGYKELTKYKTEVCVVKDVVYVMAKEEPFYLGQVEKFLLDRFLNIQILHTNCSSMKFSYFIPSHRPNKFKTLENLTILDDGAHPINDLSGLIWRTSIKNAHLPYLYFKDSVEAGELSHSYIVNLTLDKLYFNTSNTGDIEYDNSNELCNSIILNLDIRDQLTLSDPNNFEVLKQLYRLGAYIENCNVPNLISDQINLNPNVAIHGDTKQLFNRYFIRHPDGHITINRNNLKTFKISASMMGVSGKDSPIINPVVMTGWNLGEDVPHIKFPTEAISKLFVFTGIYGESYDIIRKAFNISENTEKLRFEALTYRNKNNAFRVVTNLGYTIEFRFNGEVNQYVGDPKSVKVGPNFNKILRLSKKYAAELKNTSTYDNWRTSLPWAFAQEGVAYVEIFPHTPDVNQIPIWVSDPLNFNWENVYPPDSQIYDLMFDIPAEELK